MADATSIGGRAALMLASVAAVWSAGCGSVAPRFTLAEPVTVQADTMPIAVPEAHGFGMWSYQYALNVQRPAVGVLEFVGPRPARDVNSMDDLPASTWFTPRLGYREVSPQELHRGPETIGPPQFPIAVVSAKVGGSNPGFVIRDGRGNRYLTKFDRPEFPGLETTAALVVNRLFWGFGYNVPEDYLFFFGPDDLTVDPLSNLSRAGVDSVLSRVAAPVDGRYRATVSLLIPGVVLGPIQDKGVRKDDPNDTIDHEDRRILRALHVFGALTNQTGLRADNTLDVYEGGLGRGYVKHYLVDFGESLGGHGTGKGTLWDGYSRWFSYDEMFRRLVTFGLDVEDWESIQYTQWPSVGTFEAEIFKPENWKTASPYEPIIRTQPDDSYWAAKIVGAVTEDHFRSLVEAAEYPSPDAAEYVLNTLMERRRKVLAYFLDQVSPIDAVGYRGCELLLRDVRRVLLGDRKDETRYEIRYRNDDGDEIAEPRLISGITASFGVPVPSHVARAAGAYVRVQVVVLVGDRKAPRAAEFHLRHDPRTSDLQLVGVSH
jgi:hypothetical protein